MSNPNKLKHYLFALGITFVSPFLKSQTLFELDSIVITAERIELPFEKQNKNIQLITRAAIEAMGYSNTAEVLQQITGVDIRRRGAHGMQADLYIRGGNFDQTALLIDGVRVGDAQTGHHLLNALPPPELIERIEVYKGPASRVLGQNAFNGAINIVTRSVEAVDQTLLIGAGSNGYLEGNLAFRPLPKSLLQLGYRQSDGYRYNTDFNHLNLTFKSEVNIQKQVIDLYSNYQDRSFGANGFYARPTATDQFEAIKTSFLSLGTTFELPNQDHLKVNLYSRTNRDRYLFVRDHPAIYQNIHFTHNYGLLINGQTTSKIGRTGWGLDISQTHLNSTNLGDRNRQGMAFFAEHLFAFLQGKITITPGIVVQVYSDFGTFSYPGIDLGWFANDQLRLHANWGYTYRIPTYTDLYYEDPLTEGNAALLPEEASAMELGGTFTEGAYYLTGAVFYRKAFRVIDYIKLTAAATKDKATNIQSIATEGLELTMGYRKKGSSISAGYTYLNEEIQAASIFYSRYALNSMQHQCTTSWQQKWHKNFSSTMLSRWVKRKDGQTYFTTDLSGQFIYSQWQVQWTLANLWDVEYWETNLVPMPGRTILATIAYKF